MRKPVLLVALALVPLSFAHAQIPTSERNALIALYNSTGGASWTQNTNWLGPVGTECTWVRVSCSGGHVQQLSMQNNNLSGTIPSELGNLPNLRHLYLDDNQLTGNIPPELENLSSLITLSLPSNQLGGSIPPELGNISTLYYLFLDDNQLTGSIPPELGNLSNLSNLYLQNNQLTGSIPPEMGNTNVGYTFDLSNNQLTGSIPPELGNLHPGLDNLRLENNQLSGSIPSELANLADLKWVDLSNNKLSGNIPPELGNLAYLQRLLLHDNQLSGPIPLELANLSSLLYLHLHTNRLSGSIPPELQNMTSLQWLYLHSNRLTGTIPPELGNLPALYILTLNSNMLTGDIPTELGTLGLIDVNGLDLQWNALHSDNPTLVAYLDAKHYFGVDWQSDQTVAPENPTFDGVGDHTVWLSWDAVSYQADPGGYEVFSSPTGSGVWTSGGWTDAKTTTTLPVTGLDPNTTYDLAVATITDPHTNNLNLVRSDLSAEVMTTTANTGCGQPVIELSGSGAGPFTLSLTESYGSYTWSTGETTASIEALAPYGQWYWVTVTSAGPCEETAAILVDPDVFADGMEFGDTAEWSSSVQ